MLAPLAIAVSLCQPVNAADVTFTDVAAAAGVDRSTESYGISVADVNLDTFLDAQNSNHRERPSLYINRGDGTFVDEALTAKPWRNRPGADTQGSAFGDFDNDGDQDLLVTTGVGNIQQFLVNQNGTLTELGIEYQIDAPQIGGRLPLWIDYNSDNLNDVIVTQYGGVTKLFTNRGDHFTEDTTSVRLLCHRQQFGLLMDVNRDGQLDFVCAGDNVFPQEIFDLSTQPWGRIGSLFPTVNTVTDAITGDFNNDLIMDMFVLANMQLRPSGLSQHGSRRVEFRGQGGRKGFDFTSDGAITVDLDWNMFLRADVLEHIYIGAGGRHPTGFPLTLSHTDPANHGFPPDVAPAQAPALLMGFDPAANRWQFIFQTENKWSDAYITVDATVPVTQLRSRGLWGSERPSSPVLLVGQASGWADGTAAAGLTGPVLCASVTTGDYNNDMYLDLFLACRDGAANLPNVMYFGGPGGQFRRAPSSTGIQGPVGTAIASGAGAAESAVTADFDRDGFLDIMVANGMNMRPKFTGGPGVLFRNNGNDNHWVQLDLVATASDRDAVGARVIASAGGVDQLRVQNGGYHRWVQEPARMHFGLATSTSVDLTIEWPSGAVDFHQGVAADRLYRATEGAGLAVVPGGGGGPPPPPPPVACGAPTFNPAADPGLYVWPHCNSDRFSIRAVGGGGGWAVHEGTLEFGQPATNIVPFSLEPADVLDTSNPRAIQFRFGISGAGQDGVDLDVPAAASKCATINAAPPGIFYGRNRTPVTSPFDLGDAGPCDGVAAPAITIGDASGSEQTGVAVFPVLLSHGSNAVVGVDVLTADDTAVAGSDYQAVDQRVEFPAQQTRVDVPVTVLADGVDEPEEHFFARLTNASQGNIVDGEGIGTIAADGSPPPPPCGEPPLNPGVTAGAYVWVDCGTERWHIRFTSDGTARRYVGRLESPGGFPFIAPHSVEGSDVFDTSDPTVAAFDLIVTGPWQDGIDFDIPGPASVCLRVALPPVAGAWAGPVPDAVTPPFLVDTRAGC